jgi:serine/threonine-protein kinase
MGGVGWGAAAVLAVVLGVVATRPEPPRQMRRFAVPLGDGTFSQAAEVLPDGSGIFWRAPGPSGETVIWVRHWDETEGVPIRGTEGADRYQKSISPDGTEISFTTGGGTPLLVAPLRGGSVRALADSAWGGGIWSEDGGTLYYTDNTLGISRVSAKGGPVTVVVPGTPPDSVWAPLMLLPDQRTLLARHFAYPEVDQSWIEAVDVEDGTRTVVTPGGNPAWLTPSGRLIFGTSDGTLMGAPLDMDELQLSAAATALVEGIGTDPLRSLLASISRDGTLVYLPGAAVAELTPVWVDRAGRQEIIDPEWHFRGASNTSTVVLSPDGDHLAVAEIADNANIWVKELGGGPRTRLTVDGGRRPSWSADGAFVYFLWSRNQTGNGDVWRRPADASRPPELVLDREKEINEAVPLPDGSLIFRTGTDTGGGTDADIFLMGPPGDTAVTTLVDSDFLDWEPVLSPDGRWLAYASNESGRFEVYVRPFPDTEARRWQVSVEGGQAPLWSRDGRELFYESDEDVMSASVQTSPTFTVTARTRLFSREPYFLGHGHRVYDVSPDGKRFVMLRRGGGRSYPLMVVENWASDADGRLGGG